MDCGQLLEVVARIKEKYDEIAEITGENFNIFKILGTESVESCHSKILAELLNPKGIHGCGGTFLKLFIKQFTDIDVKKFDGCQVYREYYTEKYGRPDIYINGGDVNVVIENKIYAGDINKQLKNYSDFLEELKKNGGGDGYLFYLTLDGKPALEDSSCGVEYKRLAYCRDETNKDVDDKSELAESDIITWLKACQKEVINKPLIRETLEQYINLFQTRSDKMSEEIVEKIVASADNMNAAIEISKNLSKAKEMLLDEKIGNPLKQFVEKKYKTGECEVDPWEDEKHGGGGVDFSWKSKTVSFRIGWDGEKLGLRYGIFGPQEKITKIESRFKKNGFKLVNWGKLGVALIKKDSFDWGNCFFDKLCSLKNANCFEDMIDDVFTAWGKIENA